MVDPFPTDDASCVEMEREDPRASHWAPNDTEMSRIAPSIRIVWITHRMLGAAPFWIAGIVGAVMLDTPWNIAAGTAALVFIAIPFATTFWGYTIYRYLVTDNEVWVRKGAIHRTVTVVPFSRLQFVDTQQGILERALGLATLSLYTAAVGTRTDIPGLPLHEAEKLRDRLADVDPDVLSV